MYEKKLRRAKITASVLAAVLIFVTLVGYPWMSMAENGGSGASGASGSETSAETKASDSGNSDAEKVLGEIGSMLSQEDIDKDETVYIIAGASGSPEKVIVSEWLKNPDHSETLSDKTNLTDLENVGSDGTYTTRGGGKIEWDADGKDVYYRGISTKSLPVDVEVTYYLDGKEISAEDIAGKTGKVTIRFDYTNNEKTTVWENGSAYSMHVPFLISSVMVLDNDTFSSIEVDNGKIISDGDRQIVVGFALPGLAENLGTGSGVDIPDHFEVSADVTGFELTTTVTYVSNEIFNTVDFSDVSSIDDLKSALGELQDAADKLVSGSSDLYDGVTTLYDSMGSLESGVDKLSDGAGDLSDGAEELSSGASSLADGAAALSSGLDTLSSNSAALNAGSRQVFESLLSQADSALTAAGIEHEALTPENYHSILSSLEGTLSEDNVRALATQTARTQVEAAVRANTETITSSVTDAVREQVTAQVLAQAGTTQEQYEQLKAAVSAGAATEEQQAALQQIEAAVNQAMASDDVKAQISAAVEQQIQALIEQNMASSEVQQQIESAVTAAASGRGQITTLLSQLDSYNTFYTSLEQYTAGVDQAAAGAKQVSEGASSLKDGASDLASGAKTLSESMSTLKEAVAKLSSGTGELKDGSKTLYDGMKEFKETGIDELVSCFDGDIEDLINRVRATADASESYTNFGGIADGESGSVRFVYKTGSIEKSKSESSE